MLDHVIAIGLLLIMLIVSAPSVHNYGDYNPW